MELTQCDTILLAMLTNPKYKVWDARDFQSGKYFVGYEATARISDLIKKYPTLFIVGKNGRYRTIEINWDEQKLINETIERINFILEK